MSRLLGEFRKGDDWDILIRFNLADDTPIDITGFKYTLTLVEDFGDAPALVAEHTVNSIEGAQGICLFRVDSELTAAVEAGKYYWDVQQEDPDGRINTILPDPEEYKDRFVVRPDATR